MQEEMIPRILILEPYFGGSHRHFLEGLQKHIAADYTVLTLPARKWKMRMQLSAIWCIDQLKALPVSKRWFDAVLCSTFVDVAVFRAMLFQVKGWNSRARILTYFHENQFDYPLRFADPSRHQFTSINLHSALASDDIAFNSHHNRDTFLQGCRTVLKKVTDMGLPDLVPAVMGKSRILHPGIDFTAIDTLPWKKPTQPPVIVWNHRWEHDKDPESFLKALVKLQERNIDFQVIFLGQSFNKPLSCVPEAEKKLRSTVIHSGFARTSKHYAALLSQGDIVVSTAQHEFFGIAVIEAVRAGCVPVLPDRLSYPELFDKQFLYDEDSLADRLEEILRRGQRLDRETARAMTGRFSWQSVRQDYAEWLSGASNVF